jgi:hypothetical protein
MGNDVFRVQVKSVHKPLESLFYTSNMPVLPKDGDYLYVEENGHNHQYIIDRKDWVVSSQDGNNVCLIVIWVSDPNLSK